MINSEDFPGIHLPSKVSLGPYQTSMMKLFAKIAAKFCQKSSIVDVLQGPNYVFILLMNL